MARGHPVEPQHTTGGGLRRIWTDIHRAAEVPENAENRVVIPLLAEAPVGIEPTHGGSCRPQRVHLAASHNDIGAKAGASVVQGQVDGLETLTATTARRRSRHVSRLAPRTADDVTHHPTPTRVHVTAQRYTLHDELQQPRQGVRG
jgi:hypothetical protein